MNPLANIVKEVSAYFGKKFDALVQAIKESSRPTVSLDLPKDISVSLKNPPIFPEIKIPAFPKEMVIRAPELEQALKEISEISITITLE